MGLCEPVGRFWLRRLDEACSRTDADAGFDVGRAVLLPVPEEKYCDFNTQDRKGKYTSFNFQKDLVTEGTVLSSCE